LTEEQVKDMVDDKLNFCVHVLGFVLELKDIANFFGCTIDKKYQTSKMIKINKQLKDNELFSKAGYKIPDTILQALEREGCITQNPLVWLKTKRLFAYFVFCCCEKYSLKHGEKRKIQPFEVMFGIEKISGAINDIKRDGKPPVEFEKINEIVGIENKIIMDILLEYK
jgi:hypothetical protein